SVLRGKRFLPKGKPLLGEVVGWQGAPVGKVLPRERLSASRCDPGRRRETGDSCRKAGQNGFYGDAGVGSSGKIKVYILRTMPPGEQHMEGRPVRRPGVGV